MEDNSNKTSTIPRAYDVGKGKRLAQVCVAVVYLVVSAGIVFGFAALKPILIDEGVYRDFCSQDEIDRDVPVCYGQEIRLNLMFTIAAVAANAFALPVGAVLDAYGPRATSIAGCLLLALGSLLIAYGSHLPYDGYLAGYFLLSVGGPFVFISSFHLSNTFPRHSGLILSTLTGAFDASSALFLLFRLLHGHLNGLITIKTLFLCYLIVPGLILFFQIFLMPATSYETVEELIQSADAILEEETPSISGDEDAHQEVREDRTTRHRDMASKIRDLLDEEDEQADESGGNYSLNAQDLHLHRYPSIIPQDEVPSENKIWGVMHMRPAFEQIKSPWFILIAAFTVVQMLRTNYFISTIRLQYSYLFHSRIQAEKLNHLFDILLPVGGVIAAPFVGIFLDQTSMPVILLALFFSAVTIGILGCIPNSVFAGYANISLFVLFRPFFYTTVSDYVAKVFGFQSFGKVYGLNICLAGVGNFIQAPLDVLTFKVFKENPIPVNVMLTSAAFLSGFLLLSFVWWKVKSMPDKSKPQRDLEDANIADAGNGNPHAHETDRLLASQLGSNGNPAYGATCQ
ncbi:hypothetical protein VTO42DRAFT_2007 [Malbranchea cinnamomea]